MENRIKCIIVDDESNSRIVLKSLLKKYSHMIDLVGEAQHVEAAYELINVHNPHLVFLDIQMPKANGFSLLGKFEKVPFEVIFVTSYDKYAINAIKFSALDYLLKPVELDELDIAVNKAVQQINQKKSAQPQIINLLHSLNNGSDERKIAVHMADSVKLLEEKSIIYIEADGSYCHITINSGERFITSKYLKDFEDYFGNDSNHFVRISKSILLNIKHIERYTKGEPCIIEMSNGKSFEVSRRKKQEVLEKLKK